MTIRNYDLSALANDLALQMERNGATYVDIQAATGVYPSVLSRLFNGKNVSLATVVSLTGWMGVSMEKYRL